MHSKNDSTKTFKMAAIGGTVAQEHCGGFSFENCKRYNKIQDGVILGADTRATEDTIVADKNCSKIHYIAPNIYCCGAGTAADKEYVTQLISSNIQLHFLLDVRYDLIVKEPENTFWRL
ncbi:Proteasome subunit beta type-7 [Acropora cervicornis]|uniref:Proteasome subunit beta type-7 n=1 Tax=Acropora cervicornis TaxID=6130 RepID=A0AAD9UUZ0_ACRCE|nr:Proteasome subunit beta type-7 [Acropora cervicornis]